VEGVKELAGQIAIKILIGINFEGSIGLCNLNICQQNAQVLSQIGKSIYSCKNVVYKGRRKQYLTNFFSAGGSKEAHVADDVGSIKLNSIEV
jgi:hypothetical protein